MEYGIKTKPQQQLQMIEADLKRLNVLELANCQRNKRIRYVEKEQATQKATQTDLRRSQIKLEI